MSAIGIDLGSQRTVIAAVKRGGVKILMNESSYRATRNMVGYGKAERLLGDAAKAKINRNFKNTPSYFTRILNLPFGSEEYQKERKFLHTKVVKAQDGRTAYQITHAGQKVDLSPVQVLAAHFTKVAQILKMNEIESKDLVVTVPSYFSIGEKKGVYAAGASAGVNVVQVVDESICNIKNYALFRRGDLEEEYRTVAFVDFGHSKLSVYIAEISKKDARIIYEKSDRYCGTRDLDYALYEHFRNKFEADTQCNTDENPKSKLKLMMAVEKCREVLSSNNDSHVGVEFLMDEEDLNESVSREEFESFTKNIFDRVRQVIKKVIKKSKVNLGNLNSVEIIGGGTRTPLIQSIICQEFQVRNVSKTLDQSESCARGAAIKAAEMSPTLSVVKYAINFMSKTNVKCRYSMFKKSEGALKELTGTLFKQGSKLINTMSVSVNNTPETFLEVSYDPENLPDRETGPIFIVETGLVKPKEQDYKIVLRVKVDDSLIPYFKNAELEEYYTEEVKTLLPKKEAPKPTGKDKSKRKNSGKMEEEKKAEEPQYEMKKVKKTRITQLKVTDKTPFTYSFDLIKDFQKLEKEHNKRDAEIVATNAARNDLESLIYHSRSACDGEWVEFVDQPSKQTIQSTSTQLEAWIYGEGENTTKDIYLQKLGELKALTAPIIERIEAFQKLGDALQYVAERVQKYRDEIPQNVSFVSKMANFVGWKTEKYAHLTTQDIADLDAELLKVTQYAQGLQQQLQSASKLAMPPVLVETVYKNLADSEKVLDAVLGKPKPTPPKEPEMKPETDETDQPEQPAGETMEEEQQPSQN